MHITDTARAAFVLATAEHLAACGETPEAAKADLATAPADVQESFADEEPRPALVWERNGVICWTFVTDEFFGAEITVRVGREVLDPQGHASDEEIDAAEEWILDALRVEEFPGATVRAVTAAGSDSGITADGRDISEQVRDAARRAWESFLNA